MVLAKFEVVIDRETQMFQLISLFNSSCLAQKTENIKF